MEEDAAYNRAINDALEVIEEIIQPGDHRIKEPEYSILLEAHRKIQELTR